MAYKPNIHTVSNKAYAPGQAVPTDARSMFFDENTFKFRNYASTAELLSHLTGANAAQTEAFRSGRVTYYVTEGGTTKEYWFPSGTANGDLALKTSEGTGGEGVTILEDNNL